MFLDQLLSSSPSSPTGCHNPLSGTRVRAHPKQSTDLVSTSTPEGTTGNSLPTTLVLQLLSPECGSVAPRLRLTWKCTSWHLVSPNYYSFNCSGCQRMPSAPWWQAGVTVNFYRRLPPATSQWPFAAHPDRAGICDSMRTVHSLHQVTPRSFHAGSHCVIAVTCSHPSGARWPLWFFSKPRFATIYALIKSVLSGETCHSGEGSLLISKTNQVKCFS